MQRNASIFFAQTILSCLMQRSDSRIWRWPEMAEHGRKWPEISENDSIFRLWQTFTNLYPTFTNLYKTFMNLYKTFTQPLETLWKPFGISLQNL
jgi:hypothetical protein